MNAPPSAALPRRGRPRVLEFFRILRDNMLATYSEEAYEREIVEWRMLGRHRFVVSSPAAIKHVLLDNAAGYRKTEITRRILEPGLGRGLITSEGDTWRRHRRTLSPAFDHRSIVSYIPIMSAAAEELASEWRELGGHACVDVVPEMMRVTLRIISRTMFSSDSDAMLAIMEQGAGRYQAAMRPNIMDFLGLPAWFAGMPRVGVAARALGEFDAEIARLTAARSREQGGGGTDLLSRLIAARDEQTGAGMTARELRDHMITIFTAGHETTAMAMSWTWYLLSLHPGEEARLHTELGEVLGGRAPTEADVPRLTYTRMVIEESMRLYPPVHTFAREALADDTLLGRRVPKGSAVLISPWVLHRHRLLWDHPEAFIPQRFSAEQSAVRARFSYLPFGGGRRLCIGAQFAMTEATLLLATLAQRFHLELVPGHPVEPIGLITTRARQGIRMRLTPRA